MNGSLTILHEAAPAEGPVIDLTSTGAGLDDGLSLMQRFGVIAAMGESAIDALRATGRTRFVVRLGAALWPMRESLAFWWRRTHDQELRAVDAAGRSEAIVPHATGTIEVFTPRLRLTTCARFAASTASQYFALIHGTSVFETILWNGPSALGDIADAAIGFERDLHRHPRSPVVFSIVDRSSNHRIGGCSYRPAGADAARGEIGYMIEAGSQGRGLATEAVGALVAFAFAWRCARRIEAVVFAGNIASKRVLEKSGFAWESTATSGGQKRGAARDEWRFGLTETAWRALHPIGEAVANMPEVRFGSDEGSRADA